MIVSYSHISCRSFLGANHFGSFLELERAEPCRTSSPLNDRRPSRSTFVHPEIILETGLYREGILMQAVGTSDMSMYRGHPDKDLVYLCPAAKFRDTTMADLSLP